MKIVVTGKPDLGKTTLVHILECEFGREVLVGGDALDVMKSEIFPRPQTPAGRKCFQRAFYHLQIEMENLLQEQAGSRLVICDHGTLDALAQWPGPAESFFQEVGTTLEKELARYDWVIQINGSLPKVTSLETMTPPLDPLHFWGLHPRFLALPVNRGFSFCYTEASRIVRQILDGANESEVGQQLYQALTSASSPPVQVLS